MPTTQIVFYCDDRARAPVLEWLNEVRKSDPKGWARCVARIQDLAEFGHTLDRPRAALLEDGIYELRIHHVSTQYRILYFFHGRVMAVLAVGLTKKSDKVNPAEIELAKRRRQEFESDPEKHTYQEES